MLAVGVHPAGASTSPPASSEDVTAEVVAEVSELTGDALIDAGAAGLATTPFADTGAGAEAEVGTRDGVSVQGDSLTLAGGNDITIALPIATNDSATLAPDGTLVFPSTETGLHVQVQGIAGGTARVLTVAEESYSQSATHEYAYELTLPAGASLVPNADGGVDLVQQGAQVPDTLSAEQIAAVDLDALLPEVSETDRATQAQAVLDAGSGTLAGEAPVVVGAFQAPWAVDADGTQLPSRYEVNDGSLVQVVDTTGATFPVVSDPLPLVAIALGVAARALVPHLVRAFAVQTIRAGAAFTIRGGHATFTAFKRAVGGPRSGYQWHHIVEQSAGTKRGWDPRGIHNPNNLVEIPTQVHQKCVNSWMARKNVNQFGISTRAGETMRDAVHRQTSFSTQHRIGVELLRFCGVQI
ncbi:hypothetical protein [Kineococcus gypseus]|uniref:hypothetical protein n=1 Tax=Kineococcus gypseus TaxID=1637102 RepID=UPI003D7CA24B